MSAKFSNKSKNHDDYYDYNEDDLEEMDDWDEDEDEFVDLSPIIMQIGSYS